MPNTPARPELPEPDIADSSGGDLYRAETVARLLADKRRKALEEAATDWDGCIYEAPGQDIDVGAAIRALIDKEQTT